MSESVEARTSRAPEPRCDCGYLCRGATLGERVDDGQRHAREVHGIVVSADQVLANESANAATEGDPQWP